MSIHMPEAAGKCKRLNLSDLQFRGHIRAVLHLGERVLAELLMEIEADPTDIPGKLARYAALDADALRVIGGQHQPVEQVQDSVDTITTPVVTDVATSEHISDRHFGPLSGEEWMLLAGDCRRGTGRGKSRRHFYSDQFMKLVAFHSVPLADLEAAE